MKPFRNCAHLWLLLPLLVLPNVPVLAQEQDPIVITPDGEVQIKGNAMVITPSGEVRIQGDTLVIAADGTVTIHGNALSITPDKRVVIGDNALQVTPEGALNVRSDALTIDKDGSVRLRKFPRITEPTVTGTVYTRIASNDPQNNSSCYATGAGACIQPKTGDPLGPQCTLGNASQTAVKPDCLWWNDKTNRPEEGACIMYECQAESPFPATRVGQVSVWWNSTTTTRLKCSASGEASCSEDFQPVCAPGAKAENVNARFDVGGMLFEYACYK